MADVHHTNVTICIVSGGCFSLQQPPTVRCKILLKLIHNCRDLVMDSVLCLASCGMDVDTEYSIAALPEQDGQYIIYLY